jgi:hypothetical protein
MEWICSAIVFFPIVLGAGKLFGETGRKVATVCLIVGSILLIASLPVWCYLLLHFVIPTL